MAAKVETSTPLIVVEETTIGECAIFNDAEDNEETVLFINSDKCSTSCQTDPFVADVGDYICTPRVPIFFCVQLGPNLASTQCLIPTLVSVAVGTDSLETCQTPHPGKQNPPPDKGMTSLLLSDEILGDGSGQLRDVGVPVLGKRDKSKYKCSYIFISLLFLYCILAVDRFC